MLSLPGLESGKRQQEISHKPCTERVRADSRECGSAAPFCREPGLGRLSSLLRCSAGLL